MLKLKYEFCQLCEVSELPPWHFRHKQVRYGYRKPNSNYWIAFMSIFQFHNESINMWIHYIAAGLSILLMGYEIQRNNLLSIGSTFDQILLILSILLANVTPMLFSAITHHFYFINQTTHEFCWYLDFLGMLVSMCTAGSLYIYLGFYCSLDIALLLIGILVAMTVVTYALCLSKYRVRMRKPVLEPNDRFPEFSYYLSRYAFIASVFPILIVSLFYQEYLIESTLKNILFLSCISPLITTFGIVVFAQGGVPERFCKRFNCSENTFDLVGHSHQWWHVCVAVSMFLWVHISIEHYKARVLHMDENSIYYDVRFCTSRSPLLSNINY